MQSKDQPYWLVKSGGHIIGPYVFAEVSELLLMKDLSIHDEICPAFGRWNHIRDQHAFAKVVEDVRRLEMGASEYTQTGTIDMDHQTVTVSVTEPTPSQFSDEITDDVSPTMARSEDSSPKFSSPPPPFNSSSKIKTFGYGNSPYIEEHSKRSVKFVWILMAVFVLVTMGVLGYQRLIVKPQLESADFNQLVAQGEHALRVRSYDEALKAFKEANRIRPNENKIKPFLGALLIQRDEQTVLGRRLLEEVLLDFPRYRKEMLTSIGISYLRENNLMSAESHFKQVTQSEKGFGPAHFNLGVIYSLQDNFEQSLQELELAAQDTSLDPYPRFAQAHVLIQLWKATKQNKPLIQADEILHRLTLGTYNLLQESWLLKAYINHLLDRPRSVEKSVDEMLMVDPWLTSDHGQNLFLYTDLYHWNHKLAWCSDMAKSRSNDVLGLELEAMCFIKGGQYAQAGSLLRAGIEQESVNNARVRALYAYSLFASGQVEQASVALGRSLEAKSEQRNLLPHILQARFCDKLSDKKCAKEAWIEVKSQQPENLAAIAGLMRAYLSENRKSEAQELFEEGQQRSRYYRPFLEYYFGESL